MIIAVGIYWLSIPDFTTQCALDISYLQLAYQTNFPHVWISTLLPHVCFPRGRCPELLECHRVPSKRSYAVFVRATVLHMCHVDNYNVLGCVRKGSSHSQGLRGHILKTITSKEDHVVLCISRQRSFLSDVQNQGGPDKAKLTPRCCPHGPRTFSSDWISP